MQYGGQTKNKFSTWWNNHRSFCNKFNVKDDNDRAVLEHFYKFSFNVFSVKPDIIECFVVIFVEQLDKFLLDWCENRWINYLNAKININLIFVL